jgi:hypothetical protein
VFKFGVCVAVCSLAAAGLGYAASPAAPAVKSAFDVPVKVVSLPLPANRLNPTAKPAVTCSYYSHFMVKQVDLGDQGAAELSLQPIKAALPACERKNALNEIVIPPKEWAGYFKGVSGDDVYFVGSSTFAGGTLFAVFSPNGKKLFDDVANGFLPSPSGVADRPMRLRRIYNARCSVAGSEAEKCIAQIKQVTGLGAVPDCKAIYAAKKRMLAFGIEDPTAVEYEAELSVVDGKSRFTPAADSAAICRPVDL